MVSHKIRGLPDKKWDAWEKPLVVYCQVGLRGYTALRILLQRGFTVRNLSGGYRNYELFGKPVLAGCQ